MGLRASVLLGNGLDRAVVDRIREIEARLPPERRAFDRGSPSIAYWLKHVDDLDASREWLERSLRHAMESGFEGGELHSLMHLASPSVGRAVSHWRDVTRSRPSSSLES